MFLTHAYAIFSYLICIAKLKEICMKSNQLLLTLVLLINADLVGLEETVNALNVTLPTKQVTLQELLLDKKLSVLWVIYKGYTLDLSNKNLSSIDGIATLEFTDNYGTKVILSTLAQPIDINLNNNRLTRIPQEFFTIAKIDRLFLENNRIEALPEEISNLQILSRLYMSNNKLKELPKSIGQMHELRHLYVNNNMLQILPSEIYGLTGLVELGLSCNKLKAVPPIINNLVNLRDLYLAGNELQGLPPLSFLDILSLENNQISELSIGELVNLQELNLDGNPLERWPDFSPHTRLALLTLTYIPLMRIGLPEIIGKELKWLYLDNTELTQLPTGLSRLDNLCTLSLTHNKLTEISDTIVLSCQLEALLLDYNQLSSLPSFISSLINLKILSVSNNRITSLPEDIFSDRQELSANSAETGHKMQLEYLNLSNNPLITLPSSLAKLKVLSEFSVLGDNKLFIEAFAGPLKNGRPTDSGVAYLEGSQTSNEKLKAKRKAISTLLTKLHKMGRLHYFNLKKRLRPDNPLFGKYSDDMYKKIDDFL